LEGQLENSDVSSARAKTKGNILGTIARTRAEGLLETWANLKNLRDAARMRSHYGDETGPLADTDLLELRDNLRVAWDTQDRRHRDWYLFKFREEYQQDFVLRDRWAKGEGPNPQRYAALINSPPALTSLEAALFYFQTGLVDLTRHCVNATCSTPYFIAKKKSQKYCSESCAAQATREQKRDWWRENRGKKGELE
jgi:hypothetical protein